ncbi:hypothetical protein L226DRAFT_559068 [Lentinus tigrinus ALCF2SS1-7]|uniref:uncharacterized protein n=1 Tax=Lentinus tigrinus ALCF2SS1-7 TaxID=1328758 RepID=UPI00116631B2|nr:hypothetical protein L226DRAFT_559068 [Lentinus tigrinus ALCF2SS1-7]
MANLLRAAKSGKDWTQNELEAYNISIELKDVQTFFQVDSLPTPSVDPELLTTLDADDMVADRNAELINLLDLAMKPAPSGESAGVDFAVQLFELLGYAKRSRVARTRKNIPLFVCGEWRDTKSDICLVDRLQNEILLVLQEDKRYMDDPRHPEPQLIAEAIAAFDRNNNIRRHAGEPELDVKIIPGIVLLGTTPIFYKVPVTADLVRHIAHGTYPPEKTVVLAHVPPLPNPSLRYSKGMKPLDNRQAILGSYEAFKSVVGIC